MADRIVTDPDLAETPKAEVSQKAADKAQQTKKALHAARVNVRGQGRRELGARIDGPSYRRPKWDKWRLIPEPGLWQRVALSLNIDPDSIEMDPVFGRDPILPRRLREFGNRLDTYVSNVEHNDSNKFYFMCKFIG